MMISFNLLLLLLSPCFESKEIHAKGSIPLSLVNQKIEQVTNQVYETQVKHDQNYWPTYATPPIKWHKQKGLFESFVKLNFKGNKFMKELRHVVNFPDDNGFVTMNVVEALLSASTVGLEIDNQVIKDAFNAILSHRDLNSPSGLPVFNFWNQEFVKSNASDGYRAFPSNLNIAITNVGNTAKVVEKMVNTVPMPHSVKEKVLGIIGSFGFFSPNVFSIPPDADDTSCALGVVSVLYGPRKYLSGAEDILKLYNASASDPNALALDSFLKYSYQPLSDGMQSVIDPRTYRWIRPFLHSQIQQGETDLYFISTWFQSIPEIQKQMGFQHMPFFVNNVDGSVAVNGLFGISSTILTQPTKYESKWTPKMDKLYKDTVKLTLYILSNDIVGKHAPTLLLYYPSRYAYYYFVSRLVKLLDDATKSISALPNHIGNVLSDTSVVLKDAMRKYGTAQLLELVNDDDAEYAFWDDFLGLGDDNPKAEDRLFSTSMAVNALINTWTQQSGLHLQWASETPVYVKNIIYKAGNYLISKEADDAPKDNAFFSASLKSMDSFPGFSVTNYIKTLDGSKSLSCSDKLPQRESFEYVFGVKGVIPEDEYVLKETKGCFGMPSLNPDVDYNCQGCTFPFWTAPSYTHAIRLLALVNIRATMDHS